MSLTGLLNQMVTLTSKASYGNDGRPTFGAPASIFARIEPEAKRALLPDGTVMRTDAFMMVASDTTIVTDDKITWDSVDYKVMEVFKVPGETGSVHHKEVKLMLWPST